MRKPYEESLHWKQTQGEEEMSFKEIRALEEEIERLYKYIRELEAENKRLKEKLNE